MKAKASRHYMPLNVKLSLLCSAIVLLTCVMGCFSSYSAEYSRLAESSAAQTALVQQAMIQEIIIGAAQVEKVAEELAYNSDLVSATAENNKEKFIYHMLFDVAPQIRLSESHLANYGVDIVLVLNDRPESYDLCINASRLDEDAGYQAFIGNGQLQEWGKIGNALPTADIQQTVIPLYRWIVSGIGRRQGVLRCDVAAGMLFSSLNQWPGGVYVLSGGTAVYFSGDDPWTIPTLKDGYWQEAGQMYSSARLEKLGVTLLLRQDLTPLTRQVWRGALETMALILIAGVLVMTVVNSVIRKLLMRIEQMTRAVQEMPEDGTLSDRLPQAGPDEAGQLSAAFANLNARMNDYYHRLLDEEKAKRQAQQLALQYQINPHFLFNSLCWLQMRMEEEQRDAKLSDAIAQLGQVLRYNLEQSYSASIAEERILAVAYVNFMSTIKEGSILLTVLMPEELAETRIPRFALQPMLENAITHGYIAGKEQHLRVTFCTGADRLTISVENDGKTIPADKLEALRRMLAETPGEQARMGVGLSNLKSRLALVYGDKATITIESVEGVTTAQLTLPLSLPPKG